MAAVYEYRVWCTTDNAWFTTWGEEEPTVCPDNSGHAIDASKTYITRKVSETQMEVKEEDVPTGGHYQVQCHAFDCPGPATTKTTHDITYSENVSGLAFGWNSDADMEGDVVDLSVAPNTTIGAITADVGAPDTVINVSSTVTDNIDVGFIVTLFDGTNTSVCGKCTAKDAGAGTITVETAPGQAFLAATPTYVQMTVYMMRNFEIGPPGRYIIGESKIGGSFVPAGTTIRVEYVNNGANQVRFRPWCEKLY
jgi:hypothetical protein